MMIDEAVQAAQKAKNILFGRPCYSSPIKVEGLCLKWVDSDCRYTPSTEDLLAKDWQLILFDYLGHENKEIFDADLASQA